MTSTLLISIHPEYVDKILSGEKRFEFRKTCPLPIVTHLVIYATAPKKKWIAIAEVESVWLDSPSRLWEKTKYAAGISRAKFRKYYDGKSQAVAFKLGRVFRLSPQTAGTIAVPGPQSYSLLPQNNFLKIQTDANCEVVKRTIIFVSGVHGVGKSVFSHTYLYPYGWHCVSASSIIQQISGEVHTDKHVRNVLDNQQKLLSGLSWIRDSHCDIALDGHFALVSGRDQIKLIPSQIFHDIHPSAILILRASPNIVASRLNQRDGIRWSEDFICRFQNIETEAAESFAQKNNLPFAIINVDKPSRDIVRTLKLFYSSFRG